MVEKLSETARKCGCRRCLVERKVEYHGMPAAMVRMVVCPICGNKRCPHATDHRLECTGSNAPGQKGSVYG
jgi:hypothetical protein